MARNKESLVLLLDVGPKMHGVLPQVEKVCAMLLEKKLIYNKYDEVGIVLFGTAETNNELTKEVGGYENIVVLRSIKVVDGDLVDVLDQIPRGTVPGDFLDAIIVGMDMLIKKYGPTNKGKKRLCLITNALSRLRDPYEGTKEDQVSTIAQQMTEQAIKLECVVVRGKLSGDADKNVMDENDKLLELFTKKTWAKTLYVESATSLLGALRTRSIAPVTIFRGDLEVSSALKIKVWVYKKTSEEKFPTLKKYSDKAPATDKFATHEIKVDFEYRSINDPETVVPPEQRIKGYRYGPEVVPVSSDAWEAVKFKPEKSVKLLGFTDAKNILRHYYMKDVNIFIAEPGKREAVTAISALARAMKELNKVAIVRCVWRQGQSGQEKLSKIKEIAGIDKDIPLDEDDLEEDFDPEKFDKKMNAAFGDRYYEEEDVDPEFGSESESDLEKPDFKKEDELLGLPEDWDVTKSNDGFFAERERLKSIAEDGSDVDGGEDDDEQVDEGKKKRKRKKSAIKEALDKKLEEELYKLDYEDSIGDLKTRFKYREVKPSKYGLSAADILMLDEQELNQYVSLKKLATYREKEWKVPQIQKKMFFEKVVNDKMNQKKRKRRDKGDVRETNNEKESVDAGKAQSEEPSVDESQLSRAARRRRRMKEKKLPESRLVAYGKVPSSSKNKSKS